MQVDLQVEVPKGFELTGEYRAPNAGEFFLVCADGEYKSQHAGFDFSITTYRLILRKVDTWRDATLDDLKRVMDGETVECRYVDGNHVYYGFRLAGWNTNSNHRPVWAMLMREELSELYYASVVQVKE
jgi:hypothetical protein